MRYFIKKIAQSQKTPPDESLSTLLRKGSDIIARRIAGYLSKKEQRLSLRTKKLILASFCLTVSLYGGILIYHAFAGPPNAHTIHFLQMPMVSTPVLGRLPDSLTLKLIHRQQVLSDSAAHHH